MENRQQLSSNEPIEGSDGATLAPVWLCLVCGECGQGNLFFSSPIFFKFFNHFFFFFGGGMINIFYSNIYFLITKAKHAQGRIGKYRNL